MFKNIGFRVSLNVTYQFFLIVNRIIIIMIIIAIIIVVVFSNKNAP